MDTTETLITIGSGAGLIFAAFLTSFLNRFLRGKAWRKSTVPPPPTAPPPDFTEDTGVHLMRLMDAPDQQVQLRVISELVGRIHKWTLEERAARSLDQLAREGQAQASEAVQALALAADRERALGMQRDMRQAGQSERLERVEGLLLDVLRKLDQLNSKNP